MVQDQGTVSVMLSLHLVNNGIDWTCHRCLAWDELNLSRTDEAAKVSLRLLGFGRADWPADTRTIRIPILQPREANQTDSASLAMGTRRLTTTARKTLQSTSMTRSLRHCKDGEH